MSRLKKNSSVVEAARHRLEGLKSLDEAPDFGPDLKVEDFEAQINRFEQNLSEYNTLNSTLDGKLTEVLMEEQALNIKTRRMLAAAKAKFGPDSKEYEQVGGTRDSARKKPVKKTDEPKG